MAFVLFTTYGWYQKTIIKRYSLPRYLPESFLSHQFAFFPINWPPNRWPD